MATARRVGAGASARAGSSACGAVTRAAIAGVSATFMARAAGVAVGTSPTRRPVAAASAFDGANARHSPAGRDASARSCEEEATSRVSAGTRPAGASRCTAARTTRTATKEAAAAAADDNCCCAADSADVSCATRAVAAWWSAVNAVTRRRSVRFSSCAHAKRLSSVADDERAVASSAVNDAMVCLAVAGTPQARQSSVGFRFLACVAGKWDEKDSPSDGGALSERDDEHCEAGTAAVPGSLDGHAGLPPSAEATPAPLTSLAELGVDDTAAAAAAATSGGTGTAASVTTADDGRTPSMAPSSSAAAQRATNAAAAAARGPSTSAPAAAAGRRAVDRAPPGCGAAMRPSAASSAANCGGRSTPRARDMSGGMGGNTTPVSWRAGGKSASTSRSATPALAPAVAAAAAARSASSASNSSHQVQMDVAPAPSIVVLTTRRRLGRGAVTFGAAITIHCAVVRRRRRRRGGGKAALPRGSMVLERRPLAASVERWYPVSGVARGAQERAGGGVGKRRRKRVHAGTGPAAKPHATVAEKRGRESDGRGAESKMKSTVQKCAQRGHGEAGVPQDPVRRSMMRSALGVEDPRTRTLSADFRRQIGSPCPVTANERKRRPPRCALLSDEERPACCAQATFVHTHGTRRALGITPFLPDPLKASRSGHGRIWTWRTATRWAGGPPECKALRAECGVSVVADAACPGIGAPRVASSAPKKAPRFRDDQREENSAERARPDSRAIQRRVGVGDAPASLMGGGKPSAPPAQCRRRRGRRDAVWQLTLPARLVGLIALMKNGIRTSQGHVQYPPQFPDLPLRRGLRFVRHPYGGRQPAQTMQTPNEQAQKLEPKK
ncbi:LOW QUALITY PROTEIN: hypothetical protein BU14_0339s0014 [Porphyra umbilicalis]|uniref:Uncharacterized protein n=1 Tax=Porphyra umbilicalis TaxID=2786 RepID=A0A1X6NYD0_PORUM|nr:LOW QUALITY PROTEIN: hypothetical protein BU14_0339s0014 [Porphyra umbilicalis]|eukprot:OSX73550.1 LOW QUALITY PROTEIN: hypothetical protein BU14_0339s0014 [Porphyra umbilicalis]